MQKTEDKIVLLIEDEAPLLKAIKTKLEKHEFEVVTARKVKQALNLLEDLERVDVIWLDHYLLGREDGLDFLVALKENKVWKNIPVFVVSNTASPSRIRAYLQLGIEKYYTKSDYRLEDIICDIKKTLKLKE